MVQLRGEGVSKLSYVWSCGRETYMIPTKLIMRAIPSGNSVKLLIAQTSEEGLKLPETEDGIRMTTTKSAMILNVDP
jgi:hypothetical protein